ncbi:WD repeat-containing protein [Magnaporthiopsis poae ATCC 64411]|uniref:WD repeat-containing protein n=1 Tax=Magnaporthiopsis poae (strain ATCC 64411 / 73-15) TaxID=644358 RepID=A0A0C4DU37_MAGP6|nr:WD repeat-containing protein [Magnaporthiopsis poae ATCC 64411]
MATVAPPPSKRQRREQVAKTQTQQDVTAVFAPPTGSFRARFVSGADGSPLADVVEIPFADASEKNVSLLLNTLLGRDADESVPYRFRILLPGDEGVVIDTYPADLQALLRAHGTVKVWDAVAGTLLHDLKSHAHWVNHLALSTDFVCRTGFFDFNHKTKEAPADEGERRKLAKERYDKAATIGGKIVERVVSASDDFTMYLFDPLNEGTKPISRMVGHQKQVNHVTFSPDGSLIASAGWDNHTKLWSARDGKFINTLRAHVAPVYQCAFSADSRLLVTASKDTTLKVWNVRTGKLATDLPGHEDEVYGVDWSPDGQRVASGGRDKASRVQGVCDYLDKQRIPYSHNDVFRWAGISKSSDWDILAQDRTLDPRTFHSNFLESRGRKRLFSETDIQKMEQAITDNGWGDRTLDWAALPAAAGLEIQASVDTIRTTMKRAVFASARPARKPTSLHVSPNNALNTLGDA